VFEEEVSTPVAPAEHEGAGKSSRRERRDARKAAHEPVAFVEEAPMPVERETLEPQAEATPAPAPAPKKPAARSRARKTATKQSVADVSNESAVIAAGPVAESKAEKPSRKSSSRGSRSRKAIDKASDQ
jgi:hypothetical protein